MEKVRIYYSEADGVVVIITSVSLGVVESIKNQEGIIYIEMDAEYLKNSLINAKSYKVNLETKQLDVIYYTQEELNIIQQQNKEVQDFNSRITTISEYANLDTTSISDLENYILLREQNKITGGM